ncbi:MAG: hypothetical protein R3E52_09835 [Burkholderiaceae bacterium]
MTQPHLVFHAADGQRIDTAAIQVALPDGEVFVLDAECWRPGAATLRIEPGTPEAPTGRYFSIEPGAANLVFIQVHKMPPQSKDSR